MKKIIIVLFVICGLIVPTFTLASGGGSITSIFNDGAQIDNDEDVTFFPSYGYYNTATGKWVLNIEGWIREPDNSTTSKTVVKAGFELYAGESVRDPDEFWRRIGGLVSDNESGEKIKITLAGRTYTMPDSTGGGRIIGQVSLTSSEINPNSDGWMSYYTKAANGRTFWGKVQLIGYSGHSVISDIDDTIKISEVYVSKKQVAKNTFNRDPKAAPGMATWYQQMKSTGTQFHYLTGSPWQLNTFLETFRANAGFPAASFNMKEFRINPFSSEFWDAVSSGATETQKKEAVSAIVGSYPGRTFTLIGDSGEHDPEIYGWAAANFGSKITAVYIRNVTGETVNNARMAAAFGKHLHKLSLIDMNTGAIQ